MNRRDALLTITSTRVALGSQANSKIQVGTVGTGNRGRYDTNYVAQDPRAQVVALCDLYPDQIDRAKTQTPAVSGARTFKDAAEMIAMSGLDAVFICTPVYMHPEHFSLAVAAGKHVYCEKPAAPDVAGVKKVMAAAKSAKPSQVIFFGFQQRWSPEYLAAEQIIRSGKLGEIALMRSEWIVGGIRMDGRERNMTPEQMERVWYPFVAKSGGMIVEQDCHGVDVLNWYAQAKPLSAIGVGGKGRRAVGDNIDFANVTYQYPNNVSGILTATQLAQVRGDVREQFWGSKGTITTHRKYYEYAAAGSPQLTRVDSKREITIDAIGQFLSHIVEKKPYNMAFNACDSTLTAILGRMAVERQTKVNWSDLGV
jgi:predicted dehydrogenase